MAENERVEDGSSEDDVGSVGVVALERIGEEKRASCVVVGVLLVVVVRSREDCRRVGDVL